MGFLKSLLKSIGSSEAEKPGAWLGEYAQSLEGQIRPPAHDDEEGLIDGTASDGIAWTLRVLRRTEADSENPSEYHHVVWHTDAVRRDDVVLVFSSAGDDAGRWVGVDGIHVRADEHMSKLDSAFGDLDRLVKQAQSGKVSGQGFIDQLSTMADGGRMAAFVKRAARFALPHPLAAPWHALTTDPVLAARLLTPAVIARIEAWRATGDRFDAWIRGWVGAPNVRLEAYLVDPGPRGYRTVVEIGLALARAAR